MTKDLFSGVEKGHPLRSAAGMTMAGALLLTGCGGYAASAQASDWQPAAPEDGTLVLREGGRFLPVANVSGEFLYNQDTLTPTDEMFNLFGTTVTTMCAKPFEDAMSQEADVYINIGGDITKAYSINLGDFENKAQEKILLCACGMGAATANVNTTGVNIADVLSLADGLEDAQVLKVTGSDGYVSELPLSYALENKAMIVYKVNGEKVPTRSQFWVPNTVAKYFVRDVVDIEVLRAAEVPEVEGRDAELSAEVNIVNRLESSVVPVGQSVTFEGYADDLGDPIAALEFSLDGGETWTRYDVNATTDRWVHWSFSYVPESEGTYELTVRAITSAGTVSPLAATTVFTAMSL